ncbi:MAG: PEGA domain-containing protein, partial [Magnetococcales bacterium]|nr:PEGA domain-containing protein [Magnetococcales bacterium]
MNGLLLKFKEKQKNLFRASSSWRLETEPTMVHPSVPGGMLLSGSFRGWIVVGLILMFAWNLSWNIRVFEPANAEGPAGGATIPGEGAIQAVTDPPGAGLLMDGHFVGVTPIRFDWDPGTHRLELKKFGFHDLVVDIQVARGRRMEVDLKLYPVQPTRPQGMGSVASTSVTGSTPAGVSKEYPPVVVDPLPAVGAAAKPSAWVVKPGQGEVKASEPAVKGPEGKGSGRVYTVEDADSQKITGRVQEMARSEMPFRYTIQVGAFLDRESALKLAAHWRRKGYDAYLLELYGIKDPSRLWQSVRIGRFDNIMEARRFLDDFHAKEKSDGYLALSDSFAPPTQALLTSGQGAGKGAGRGVPPVAANKDPVGLTSPSPAVGPGAQPKQ